MEKVQSILSVAPEQDFHVAAMLEVIHLAIDTVVETEVMMALVEHAPGTAHIFLGEVFLPLLLHNAVNNHAPHQVIKLLMDLNPDALSQPCGSSNLLLPLHMAC